MMKQTADDLGLRSAWLRVVEKLAKIAPPLILLRCTRRASKHVLVRRRGAELEERARALRQGVQAVSHVLHAQDRATAVHKAVARDAGAVLET